MSNYQDNQPERYDDASEPMRHRFFLVYAGVKNTEQGYEAEFGTESVPAPTNVPSYEAQAHLIEASQPVDDTLNEVAARSQANLLARSAAQSKFNINKAA